MPQGVWQGLSVVLNPVSHSSIRDGFDVIRNSHGVTAWTMLLNQEYSVL